MLSWRAMSLAASKGVVQLRLFPDTRFGTERFPEKVARRLRTVNLTTWMAATITTCFSVAQFLNPAPGLWKTAAVNAFAAAIYASVPLLHRFGSLAAGVTLLIVAYANFFALIYFAGTGTGLNIYFLVAAGL